MLRIIIAFALSATMLAGQLLAVPCIHMGTDSEAWRQHNLRPHFHWRLGLVDRERVAHTTQHGHLGSHHGTANDGEGACLVNLRDHDHDAFYLDFSSPGYCRSQRESNGPDSTVNKSLLAYCDGLSARGYITSEWANQRGWVDPRAARTGFLARFSLRL